MDKRTMGSFGLEVCAIGLGCMTIMACDFGGIVQLDLIETKTFGSRVIYERYRRARAESD